MAREWRLRLWALALAGLATVALASTALAHGGATMEVTPMKAAPGETVRIVGVGFDENYTYTVMMEGIRGNMPLTSGTTDDKGSFDVQVPLPHDMKPGTYQMKAMAGDSEVAVEFAVLAPAGETQSMTAGESSVAPVEEQPIIHQRTTAETVTIGIVLMFLALAGAFLAWTGAHAVPVRVSNETRPQTDSMEVAHEISR